MSGKKNVFLCLIPAVLLAMSFGIVPALAEEVNNSKTKKNGLETLAVYCNRGDFNNDSLLDMDDLIQYLRIGTSSPHNSWLDFDCNGKNNICDAFSLLFFLRRDPALEPVEVKITFLHHSTGGNVKNGAGGIEAMFSGYNSDNGTHYLFSDFWEPPDGGNYAWDYLYRTFTPDKLAGYSADYDLVIWKHCYPGSAVEADLGTPDISSSRQSIENYKLQYREIRKRLDQYPQTRFMLWTLPPLHRLASDSASAARATEFTEWVKEEYLLEEGEHPNQYVWDIRQLLTGDDNYLKYWFEGSHNSSDSHPNSTANDSICPIFFQAIVDLIEDNRNDLLYRGVLE